MSQSDLLSILTCSRGRSVFVSSGEGLQCETERLSSASGDEPGKGVPSDRSTRSGRRGTSAPFRSSAWDVHGVRKVFPRLPAHGMCHALA